eukprot:403361618
MKLLDPLQGYKIASQIIFLQLAYALALGILIFRDEVQFSDRDQAIGIMMIVHITSYILEYIKILAGICGIQIGLLKYTISFLNAALYQGAIFYAQVKFLESSQDLELNLRFIQITDETPKDEMRAFLLDYQRNSRAQQWLQLEISFYYMTLIATVLFLLLQHFFKLEIKTPIAHAKEREIPNLQKASTSINDDDFQNVKNVSTSKQFENVTLDGDDETNDHDSQQNNSRIINNNNKSIKRMLTNLPSTFWDPSNLNQDFLQLTNFQHQAFLFHTNVAAFSSYVLLLPVNAAEDGQHSYKYSIIILAVVSSIVWLYYILDHFTKITFPAWFSNIKIITYVILVADIIYMIVALLTFGDYELILRYWITIYLNIVLAYLIAEFTLFYAKRFGSNVKEVSNVKVDTEKKTLISHFMNSVNLNVDIYSITFASFETLDKELKPENQDPLIDQNLENDQENQDKKSESSHNQSFTSDMKEDQAIPNSDREASKNFSNSVFIFIVQCMLVALVLDQFKKNDSKSDVTFEILLARILCAALLHMQLEGEIRQSLQMLNYSRLMVYNTKYRYPMIIVSLMQFLGSFGTEVVNIFLICQQDTVQDVIMNFIALGVIAEIDDIYAGTLYNNEIKNKLEAGEISLLIKDHKPVQPFYASRWNPITWIHGVLRCYYECYYYYFMPFTVIVITFFSDLMDERSQLETIKFIEESIREYNRQSDNDI